MSWTCEQSEARLSDYLDGVLNPAELAEFTAHVPSCARCAPLVASVSDLLTGLRGLEEIAEPPRLVSAILDKTLGPRESLTGWRAILGWVRGVASIRFAYGALSVAATLIIFITASGFNWRHPKLADLKPATIYHLSKRGQQGAFGVCEQREICEQFARGERNSIAFARGERPPRKSGEHCSGIVPAEATWPQRWLEARNAAAAEPRQRPGPASTSAGDGNASRLRRAWRTMISRSVL